MSIVFDPKSFVKKVLPDAKIKRLVKGNLSLKRAALSFTNGAKEVDDISFKIDKKSLENVALKTLKSYRDRVDDAAETETGGVLADARAAATADALGAELASDPRQLIQRMQNEVIFQIHDGIKKKYGGQRGVWLPSDANEPRPEHQLNYGKEYIIGEGIDGVEPGDEPGCQCGVEILTDDDTLELD